MILVLPPGDHSVFPWFFLLDSPFPLLTQPSCSPKSEWKLWGKVSSSEAATLRHKLRVLVASLPSGASGPCRKTVRCVHQLHAGHMVDKHCLLAPALTYSSSCVKC